MDEFLFCVEESLWALYLAGPISGASSTVDIGLADVVAIRTGIVGNHGSLIIVIVNLLLVITVESDTLFVALDVAYGTKNAGLHGVPCILTTLEDREARCIG